MLTQKRINNIDLLLKKLAESSNRWMSLAIAIDLANEVMKGILPEKKDWHSSLARDVQNTGNLPEPHPMDTFSTQKQYTWFNEHPDSGSARSAFKHFYAKDSIIESNFYWFSENATKQKISAATQFLPNWEDSNLTKDSNYKIGIDFFLTHDQRKVLMVVTNNQNLRVLELTDELSNTQKQIFSNSLFNIPEEKFGNNTPENKRVLHDYLWNGLQLKEVNNKFYKGIVQHFETLTNAIITFNNKTEDDANQFASRLLGRLLFVWFLRKMRIINENYGYFDVNNSTASIYYEEKLKLLFFKTLNTPIEDRDTLDIETPYLNGGLFEPKENDFYNDYLKLPDSFFISLFNHFNEFNFTTDESSSDFELIAVDPEMLGQVFESLLDSQLNTEGESERNKSGSFYTPRDIVNFMCKESLRQYLYNEIDNSSFENGIDMLLDMSDAKFMEKKSSSSIDLWGISTKNVLTKIEKALDEVKVIDPAVGSGAFPIGMMQIMLKLYERIQPMKRFNSYKSKISIIRNNIFGVDNQPMAVEISRLRAWLTLIVDESDADSIEPLPNLEFKFLSADSLTDLDKSNNFWSDPDLDESLDNIRKKYFNARKPNRKLYWQKEYYKLTDDLDLFEDKRTSQLKSFDPFKNRFAANYYDSKIMFGIEDGFDIVIGNPPYGIKFSDEQKKELSKLYPNVPDYEAANYFISKSKSLVNSKGFVSFIIPNTVLTNVYAKKYRYELLNSWSIPHIVNFSKYDLFESATVRNIILNLSTFNTDDYQVSLIDGINENIEPIKLKEVSKKYLETYIDSWLNLFYQSNDVQGLIEKIKLDSSPLKNFASVSQGITPYDSHRGTPKDIKESKAYHADSKIDVTYKKLLKGKDVKRYSVNWNGEQWIKYGKWLANPRDPKFFKLPRLLYREITNPYIFCAYTDEELYNNPSIINATDFKDINIYYVLALSNSRMMNFYHKKNSPKSNKGQFPKMLIKDVRELPIKIIDESTEKNIICLVRSLLIEEDDDLKKAISDEIDSIVYEIYGLEENEIEIIKSEIPDNWLD